MDKLVLLLTQSKAINNIVLCCMILILLHYFFSKIEKLKNELACSSQNKGTQKQFLKTYVKDKKTT